MCNSEDNYFYENEDSCKLCSIDNCLKCESLDVCKECEDGYTLLDNRLCSEYQRLLIVIGAGIAAVPIIAGLGFAIWKKGIEPQIEPDSFLSSSIRAIPVSISTKLEEHPELS